MTHWRFVEREPLETFSQRVREAIGEWRDRGIVQSMRATEILPDANPSDGPAGMWLEGWETEHPVNGPFNPPLTTVPR